MLPIGREVQAVGSYWFQRLDAKQSVFGQRSRMQNDMIFIAQVTTRDHCRLFDYDLDVGRPFGSPARFLSCRYGLQQRLYVEGRFEVQIGV